MSQQRLFSLQERAAPDLVCYCCGPAHPTGLRIKSFWDEAGKFVVTRHTPRAEFAGFTGLVYGGLLAMLVDCHCGWTAMAWHGTTVPRTGSQKANLASTVSPGT